MSSPRPTWKGLLQISLVRIPIKVFPATESSTAISLNQLHSTCRNRITQKKWCAGCNREVPTSEIVKGYEFESGKYVELLDDELDALKTESTRVIDLVQFPLASDLRHALIAGSYTIQPDGPVAAYQLAVVRAGLDDRIGIGKVALYGREYLVAVALPWLYTLHWPAEMRALPDAATPATSTEDVILAERVIALFDGPLNLDAFTNEADDGKRRLIAAKIAGEEYVVPTLPDAPAVKTLQEQLRASLDAVKATRARPIGKMTTLARKHRQAS